MEWIALAESKQTVHTSNFLIHYISIILEEGELDEIF